MAKLYFNYSSMNAGKSTVLLQAAYNYKERGMKVLLLIAAFDDRAGKGTIASRIGLSADADVFNAEDNVFEHVRNAHETEKIDALFVDEAQFLTEEQVWQLARIADELRIPVLCFGLRTDFQGKLFPGSAALLAISDSLKEIKTICWCGRKATMVARLDGEGRIVEEGDQVVIGGNETYVPLCRKHWYRRELG
ncbi:MAG: thymidine kinase [Roseibium sp.]|uniref:thymidine kinase n=1 Tax=Roseibium sp. TaxID=1936156 RepID=UPI001B0B0664|nr:thymidine kinase [Roseibium sp.]MBO6894191.1 thymidine kinase [Roseibium sp.]MBO6928897.1 thymidine kinase [Roseibium sp.]